MHTLVLLRPGPTFTAGEFGVFAESGTNFCNAASRQPPMWSSPQHTSDLRSVQRTIGSRSCRRSLPCISDHRNRMQEDQVTRQSSIPILSLPAKLPEPWPTSGGQVASTLNWLVPFWRILKHLLGAELESRRCMQHRDAHAGSRWAYRRWHHCSGRPTREHNGSQTIRTEEIRHR